ncbi:MAG: carbohydrate kinase family protein [Spirochaetota bacterium]
MPDVVSIGEALIDFLSVEKGVLLENARGFTIAPGGAPANVAAAVSRLGGSAGFIGKVGNDPFGRLFRNTLAGAGVNIDLLRVGKTVNTTLAFIAVKPDGEPDFTFYRKHGGADISLRQDEVDKDYILTSKIFHFGSLSFTDEPMRSTTLSCIEIARGSGKVISFDPNLRPSLWDNLQQARAEMRNGLQYADMVKLTVEELELLTGTKNLSKGFELIFKQGPRMAIVTRGEMSCFFSNLSMSLEVPAFRVELVDATGAGDAFVGGVLFKVLQRINEQRSIFDLQKDEAVDMLRFAHACGAITVTRKGVIPALPSMEEVEKFLKENPGENR